MDVEIRVMGAQTKADRLVPEADRIMEVPIAFRESKTLLTSWLFWLL